MIDPLSVLDKALIDYVHSWERSHPKTVIIKQSEILPAWTRGRVSHWKKIGAVRVVEKWQFEPMYGYWVATKLKD